MKRIVVLVFLLGFLLLPGTVAVRSQAPTVDRVGYPEGYQTDYQLLYAFDRPDNRQIRVVYGNNIAASTKADETFPYGSILVMETWSAKRDAQGNPTLDSNGRFERDQLTGIFVSRKEKDFGEAYGANRNGEWEHVAYRADRSYLTTPQNSASCASCHLQAGKSRDWVFRASLHLSRASGAVPLKTIQHYTFVPNIIRVRPGTRVTWYNDDEVTHRIRSDNGGFASDDMKQGTSFSIDFNHLGQYDYNCPIHPRMRGTVVVDLPTLEIRNSTTAARNTAFAAGDTWSLQVNYATPKADVYLRIWKNGQDLGVSGPYGTTDVYGYWSGSGTFSAAHAGSWEEQIVIGTPTSNETARSRISFTVSSGSASPR